MVGKDWDELDNANNGRENVNQSVAVWTGLKKGIERDKTLLDIDLVNTAGSPSEAWKISLEYGK